jgi:transketolase
MVITVEDNYGGGIGSAVADAVSADGGGFNVNQMYVRRIPKSGKTPEDVLHYCGISADHIVHQAMSLLQLTAT